MKRSVLLVLVLLLAVLTLMFALYVAVGLGSNPGPPTEPETTQEPISEETTVSPDPIDPGTLPETGGPR